MCERFDWVLLIRDYSETKPNLVRLSEIESSRVRLRSQAEFDSERGSVDLNRSLVNRG